MLSVTLTAFLLTICTLKKISFINCRLLRELFVIEALEFVIPWLESESLVSLINIKNLLHINNIDVVTR